MNDREPRTRARSGTLSPRCDVQVYALFSAAKLEWWGSLPDQSSPLLSLSLCPLSCLRSLSSSDPFCFVPCPYPSPPLQRITGMLDCLLNLHLKKKNPYFPLLLFKLDKFNCSSVFRLCGLWCIFFFPPGGPVVINCQFPHSHVTHCLC